jgi:ribonuclease PH
MDRSDGRKVDQLRKIEIVPDYIGSAPGSVLFCMGNTRVICTVTVQAEVPGWMRGKGQGWLTAEYSMLPRSSPERIRRERGKVGGRTQEIQRLIGRSLRSIIDFKVLGERTIMVDCDVIEADGGTRCASITGGCIALHRSIRQAMSETLLADDPTRGFVAAISAGVCDGQAVLDLPYTEDSTADVDLNVVMTDKNKMVEVQGTAEGEPFSKDTLDDLLALAGKGIKELVDVQKAAIKG